MKIITNREYAFFTQFMHWFKEKTDTDLTSDFKEFCSENVRILDKDGEAINPRLVLLAVSNTLSIPEVFILSKNRKRELVEARTIIARILLDVGKGTVAVGLFLGGRDHSTVIHMGRNHRDLMEYDNAYKSKYDRVITTLQNNGVL